MISSNSNNINCNNNNNTRLSTNAATTTTTSVSPSPLLKDYSNVSLRPLPARRNHYQTTTTTGNVIMTTGPKLIEGVSNYILATKVQLYRSYKVDLTWKRAVHSCSRCPKAQLNSISLVSPYPTQSDIVNRFCPAGVHMGQCTPFSEILHHHTIHRHSISLTDNQNNNNNNKPDSTETTTTSRIYNENPENFESIYSYAPPNLPHPRLSIVTNNPTSSSSTVPISPPSIISPMKGQTPQERPAIISRSGGNNNNNRIKEVEIALESEDNPPLVRAEVDIDGPESEPRQEKINPVTNSESSNVTNAVMNLAQDQLDYRPVTPQRPEMRTRRGLITTTSTNNNNNNNNKINNDSASISSPQTPTVPMVVDDAKNDIVESPLDLDNDTANRSTSQHEVRATVNSLLRKELLNSEEKVETNDTANIVSVKKKERKVPLFNFNKNLVDNNNEEVCADSKSSITSKVRTEIVPEIAEKPRLTKDSKGSISPLMEEKTSPEVAKKSPTINYDAIPRFYFPANKARTTQTETEKELARITKEIEAAHNELEKAADSADEKKVETEEESALVKPKKRTVTSDIMIPYENFDIITEALGVSLYWKRPIYLNCGGDSETDEPISLSSISTFWRKVLSNTSDIASRFIHVLTNGKSKFLEFAHFEPVIYDIIYTHPGLKFLKSAPDFHHKYVSTVIARIFFCINSSWSGRISLIELRNSNFLAELQHVAEESDINVVTQYFSYEHFYVIYCRFWELDTDHDLIINKEDLKRHNNYAISERMIDRIFSGAVTRAEAFTEGIMTYTDFVWFLIAEEDKRHPRSIEYWFRCMDLDGDGILSMYELEYFYTEQLQRMEEFATETISFQDTLCQCLDMVKPALGDKIRLSDLKKCKLCHIFFDIFFNVQKVIRYDTRDPFTNLRDIQEGLNEVSDWDRYADEAYDLLTAIECSTDGNMNFEDDDEEFDGGVLDVKPDKVDSSNVEND